MEKTPGVFFAKAEAATGLRGKGGKKTPGVFSAISRCLFCDAGGRPANLVQSGVAVNRRQDFDARAAVRCPGHPLPAGRRLAERRGRPMYVFSERDGAGPHRPRVGGARDWSLRSRHPRSGPHRPRVGGARDWSLQSRHPRPGPHRPRVGGARDWSLQSRHPRSGPHRPRVGGARDWSLRGASCQASPHRGELGGGVRETRQE